MNSKDGNQRLRWVPSFGYRLEYHEDLYHKINEEVTKYLQVK